MASGGSPRWNQTPVAYADKIGKATSVGSAFKSVASCLAGIGVTWLTYKGLPLVQHALSTDALLVARVTLLSVCGACLLILVRAVLALAASHKIRSKQQALPNAQRKLLGLPEKPTPVTPASEMLRQRKVPAMPPPSAGPSTPITTPSMQRLRMMGEGGTPAGLRGSAVSQRSSVSGGTGRSPFTSSPRGNRPAAPVATPQQLKPLLDALLYKENQQPAAGAEPDPGTGLSAYDSPTYSTSFYDAAPGTVLPVGPEAPTYQMSWLLKRRNIVAASPGSTSLLPSSEQEVAGVLALLHIRPRDLRVWTDRLREWLPGMVLKPLVAHLELCHQEVNALLLRLGHPARVAPLRDVIAAATSSLAADTENLLQTLLHACVQPMPPPQQQEAAALASAASRYQALLQLLRGRWPEGLLPPCPASYVAGRLAALAAGNCLEQLRWNGGGDFQGRSWSADLPNDSALLLYVFAAFLAAPGWNFPQQAPGSTAEVAKGMPLYLGRLPQRPPYQYSAILAFRPEQLTKEADAVLATNLSTASPHFSFVLDGRLVTLVGRNALFHVVLLMLQLHKLRYHGLLGPAFLPDAALRLAEVIEPAPPAGSVPQRFFSWWFHA